ncbi:MAG: LuxR C-terminal-related transcriptional regulator [Treponema sp.]|jgi:LuxR family maltose regulon positive regulatory protein|nr:LuxR C-terminal-related transcriptional regulator [Treponema sp.]
MPEGLFQNTSSPLNRGEGPDAGIFGPSLVPDNNFILERPRINALLEQALRNSVVTVTAGEGYGKTHTVYSFLRRRAEAAVWIPLSDRDNSPWRFWENFCNALGRQNQELRKVLTETGFPETPGQINSCIAVLWDAVSGSGKHIIVIDDFHLIHAAPIIRFLEHILAAPSPNQTFILISRIETEINTMPLLSKGLLSHIGAEELRFSEDEITSYFRIRNIEVSPEEAREIFQDTEGWALAISLLAEELKSGAEKYTRHLLEKGSFKVMEDTLYASIPESLQRFLIILSLFEQWPLDILERIAATMPIKLPALEELTGNMKRLSALIRYDVYLHGFRIHRIFLDYLRKKQHEIPREQFIEACSIAAQWCMENDLRMDAAFNYERAGDYKGILMVIYSFPRLFSCSAAAALLEILDRVFRDERRDESSEDFLFLRYVAYSKLLINMGKFAEAAAGLYEGIKIFEALPPSPLSSWILSGCYTNLGSLSILNYRETKDFTWTIECFQKSNYYYMRHPKPLPQQVTRASVSSYVNQVTYPPRPGEFEEAIEFFARCIPHTSYSHRGYLCGMDSLAWAELAYFKGDLPAAEQHVREAIFKAHEKEQYETENRGLFYLLRINLHTGDFAGFRDAWRQMEAQLEIQDYINRYLLFDIAAGWFYAHIGETGKIAFWLKSNFDESELISFFYNFEIIVKAKYLYAEKRYRETLELIRQKKAAEGLGSFLLGKLELAVIEAAVRMRMGDIPGAVKALETAYEVSFSNSLDMPFIELGEEMRFLAGAALAGPDCSIPRQWLESIRSKASAYGKKLILAAEQCWNKTGRAEIPFLTRQERAVLCGLSRGYNREKIAGEENISIGAVKMSIKNLYTKLGALNRADAIRIATRYNILPKNNS